MGLAEIIESLRADWWSALLLGVAVYVPLSLLALVPLYVGPALLVTVAPYASARFALRDIDRGHHLLGAVLGAMEATLLLVFVVVAMDALLGSVHASTLEGAAAVALYVMSMTFGLLGAASLDR